VSRSLREVLNEPLCRGSRRRIEFSNVRIEMAARQGDKPFRSQCSLVGSQGLIGDSEMVTKRDNHHQRRGTDEPDITARLVP